MFGVYVQAHERFALGFSFLVALAVSAAADVEWPAPEIRRAAQPGVESIVATFSFHNRGARAVRVLALRPNCDCLAATVAKNEWAAGERGAVHVVFTFSGRTGRQDKAILVTMDDAPDKPVVLKLTVDLPEDVMIRPRVLSWEVGGKPVEKVAEVIVLDADQVAEVGAQCSDERFQAKVKAAGTPGFFRVEVRPVETSVPAQTTIRLNVTLAGRTQVHVLHAAVK